jgi:undecaprenyl-diphosphatase
VNYDLFRAINNWSGNGAADALMKVAAQDLIYLIIGLLALVVVLRVRRHELRPVLTCAVALIVTFLLGLLAASLHPEKRPFQAHRVHQLIAHAPGQSFPSDHATASFGIALAVAAFLSWRWGLLLFALAIVVGFARVYAGIHYPGDIAGSLLVAALGVATVAGVAHLVPTPVHARAGRSALHRRA